MAAPHVGIYTRVSSQRQAEKWSLQAQRKVLTAHASKRGWVADVHDEGGVSAETIAARPLLQRLLTDVASGVLDAILVIEIERLCRVSDLPRILSKPEKRTILEPTRSGKKEACDSGKYIGGATPTG
jgi:DNA invertase Pin-like site-specific DNA recombinase